MVDDLIEFAEQFLGADDHQDVAALDFVVGLGDEEFAPAEDADDVDPVFVAGIEVVEGDPLEINGDEDLDDGEGIVDRIIIEDGVGDRLLGEHLAQIAFGVDDFVGSKAF